MNTFSLTCLIPFYNEGARCVKVLEILTTVPEISQFICVDDGSSDDTAARIQKKFPQVQLISLPKNCGKSAAVAAGVKLVQASHILLFDADMHDFSASDVRVGIKKTQANPDCELLIFQQKNDPLLSKLFGTDILFSGERIVRTASLKKFYTYISNGYELELAMNRYFFKRNHDILTADLHAKNYLKLAKWPVHVALKKSFELVHLLCSAELWRQRKLLKQMK